MSHPGHTPIPGVHALEHTADVGLELSAPDLPELLRRGALGLAWLLLERQPSGAPEERKVHARGDDPATLLRELLRELLWWHDAEGLTPVDLTDLSTEETEHGLVLTGSVRVASDPDPPLREIKGVTLHRLVAERRGEGWYGRVIFDV